MGDLKIEIEAFPGAEISRVCRSVIALADKLGITVMCPFNGVRLMACPGDSAERLESDWRKKMKSDDGYNLARGHPPHPLPERS